jgi:hypothetical protein
MESAAIGICFVNTVPGCQNRLTCIAVDNPLCLRLTFRCTDSLPTIAIPLSAILTIFVSHRKFKRNSVQPVTVSIRNQRETLTVVVRIFCDSSPSTQLSRAIVIKASAAPMNSLDSCQADIPRFGTGGNAEWPLFPKAATQIIENRGN